MANPAQTVLITGGCGFLGSHLAETHLRQGDFVVCVDNFSTALKSNATFLKELGGDRVLVIEADVSKSWSEWAGQIPAEKLSELGLVYHFASPASPPLYQELAFETMDVNTDGLKQALSFADLYKARCVFASTSEIYGDPEVHPQAESYWGNVNTLGPRSCYDEAKRFGETILYTHNWKKGTKHGLVRIFNTYGPRMNPQDGRVVINFLVQAAKGEKLTVYGDGKQTRSFCYVDDLVAGIQAYAKSEETSPFNFGNQKEFTILELAQTVQEMFSEKKLELSHKAMPQDDPKQRCPDTTKARERFQWEAKVPLKEGLQKLYSWLEEDSEFLA